MTTSLLDTFLTRARQLPDVPVLDFERRRFTAGQLAADVTAFARALRDQGLVPGDRVALFPSPTPGHGPVSSVPRPGTG